MYNATNLLTGFASYVGWKQRINPDYPALSSTNTTSSSGRYFNEFHPLCSVETLDSVMEDYDNMNFSAWSSLTTYSAGDRVKYSGRSYVSLVGTNLNKQPDTQTSYWRTCFDAELKNLTDAALLKVVDQTMNVRKIKGASKALFDSMHIF